MSDAHHEGSDTYHEGSRRLQDRFDTRRLADRLDERHVADARLSPSQRELIERLDMFFLATADAEGRPQCSYKGGDPGLVRVLDELTLAFPSYDGNGMFLSLGNLLVNPQVGLLFVDFRGEPPSRLRVNGVAELVDDPELCALWPGAQLAVVVRIEQAFPNCPRYVHRLELVERSRFVPDSAGAQPVPAWKRSEWARDALPAGDPARADAGAPTAPGGQRTAAT